MLSLQLYKNCINTEQTTTLTLLLLTMFDWINKKINVSDEVWRRVHQKYGMSQIVRTFELNRNQKMQLPQCSQRCSIKPTKQLTWVMNDERQFIKTMEHVESYINCVKSKQANTLYLLFTMVFDSIAETMNESDEVWRWVHQNYGMSKIIKKLY